MDSEQQIENQERPAEKPAEKPAEERTETAAPQQDNRRPRGRGGRGRFRGRGDRRDRGGERNDRPPRNDSPRSDQTPQRRPAGSIGRAMEVVEQIRTELKHALDDMDEVLNMLEQIERDQNASEDEIEALKDSLSSLHRNSNYPRSPRNNPPPRPAQTAEQPVPDAESLESANDDDRPIEPDL